MENQEDCPVCSAIGRTGKLILRNINEEEAIYVCSNSQCPYPVGLSDQVITNLIPELQPEDKQDQKPIINSETVHETTPQVEQVEDKIIVQDVNVFLDPEDNTLLNKLMDEL